jgi:hypothetical protein
MPGHDAEMPGTEKPSDRRRIKAQKAKKRHPRHYCPQQNAKMIANKLLVRNAGWLECEVDGF